MLNKTDTRFLESNCIAFLFVLLRFFLDDDPLGSKQVAVNTTYEVVLTICTL